MKTRWIRFLAVALLWAAAPASAQIVTENAGAISPETPILRESLTYLDSKHATEARWIHQLILSVDPSRELKLSVPLAWKEVEFDAPDGGEDHENFFGLGDISLRFKQSLWQKDDVLESTRWAVIGEVGAPTGNHHESDDGIEVPRRLALGTGDWTLGVGTAFTVIRNRHRFSAEVFFRHRTRHDGVRFGETVDLNLAYWYRFAPARFDEAPDATEVRGVVELLSTYRSESRFPQGGADDQGVLLWVAPGIQVYPSKTVLIEGSLQIPVYQSIDDALGDRDWGATLAVKFLF